MTGWQPVDGFDAHRPKVDADEQLLEDNLFLALRQCATHPAGPLRIVSELRRAQLDGSHPAAFAEMQYRLGVRLRQMQMPPERREVAERFMEVVFAGLDAVAPPTARLP